MSQAPRARLTRRQALLLGIVGVPVAAASAVALRHGGDPGSLVELDERAGLTVLSVRQYATLKCVLRAMASSTGTGFPTTDEVKAAPWAERYLADLPRADLRDVRALLGVVEHVLPLACGTTLPFSRLEATAQHDVLDAMERSVSSLMRAGFAALKQITAMAYFRHERTWSAIGYGGPWVRPLSDPAPREVYGTPIAHDRGRSYEVDAVVVGSGAGGSMAAREVARAGASTLLLEEGDDHPPESFTQREDEMLSRLFQERGGRATSDRAIHVLQGRGLGGSTLHNQNLCKRAPNEVLAEWEAQGLAGWGPEAMAPLFSEVEALLGVQTIEESDINPNNDVLRRGAERLGWRSGILSHNREGCRRSGFCELGCAYDGKNNARKVVIPEAVRHGARVRVCTNVQRVLVERGQAVGVVARDGRTGETITVRARAVVLAASAVGSAVIALQSGLADPHDRIGRGLHLHPGGVVAGVFDRELDGWRGIPQSWECTEWLRFGADEERRVWIVPAFAHPVGTAAMLPGVGDAWLGTMRKYRHTAVLTAMVHDRTDGRVNVKYGRPVLEYAMSGDDREQMARGLRACAEILLAAGAREVVFPFAPPARVRRASELPGLRARDLQAHAMPVTAVHPMSSMRASASPEHGVCGAHGQHHYVRGLFVADGGLFPTSLGGPPQVSIYATGMKVGREVVRWLGGRPG